jgi:Amino acid synthesis
VSLELETEHRKHRNPENDMAIKLRKLIVQVDETRIEMGQTIDPPTRRAVAIAVIDNPYAGRYEAKLDALIAAGEELGALLGNRCVEALGIKPGDAQSYGKAAIVGEAGELEHAAAILHPKLGAPLRVAVEKGAALVPSAKKMGTLGTAIDVPLGHKDAAFVRSHFDAIEARVADAPRANEIVVAVAVTASGRPLPRIGGLQVSEIKGEDGLR